MRKADVLYLHRADPKDAVDFDASPEGHALRYNAAEELIGAAGLAGGDWEGTRCLEEAPAFVRRRCSPATSLSR